MHLLKLAVKDSHWAYKLLTHPRLSYGLSLNDVMHLVSQHASVLELLKQKPWYRRLETSSPKTGQDKTTPQPLIPLEKAATLTKDGWIQLARDHQSWCQALLKRSDLILKLKGDDWVLIAQDKPGLAWFLYEQAFLFQNPLFTQSLELRHACLLAQWNVHIAKSLLTQPFIKKKLTGEQLTLLGQHHEEIAFALLQSPWFCKKIKDGQWLSLAQAGPHAADKILQAKPVNKWAAYPNQLFDLSQKYLGVLRWLSKHPELEQSLKPAQRKKLQTQVLLVDELIHAFGKTKGSSAEMELFDTLANTKPLTFSARQKMDTRLRLETEAVTKAKKTCR